MYNVFLITFALRKIPLTNEKVKNIDGVKIFMIHRPNKKRIPKIYKELLQL